MCDNILLRDKVTILVNSCDAYSDLWMPFFTLLRKYWNTSNIRLLLNTESKTFNMDGLNIECVHPDNVNDPYGKRMINVLSKITTPYVIPLLDDFFLRKAVDVKKIIDIIGWMDGDSNIVYFNCDNTPVYTEWEKDKYPGFHRIPYGNEYTLNMQTAVWRTEKLKRYWISDVSPWEWEEYHNLIASRTHKDKFYCVYDLKNGFCDYGYTIKGMGVHHGKWVENDVVPFFKKERIDVNFSKRGFLESEGGQKEFVEIRESLKTIKLSSEILNRCLNISDRFKYMFFVKRNSNLRLLKNMPEFFYIKYSLFKERKKFFRKLAWKERAKKLKNKFNH